LRNIATTQRLPTLAELNKVPSTPVIKGSPTNSIVGNRVLQDVIAPNTTTKPAGTIGTGGIGGSTSSGGSTGTGSSGSVTKPSTVIPTSVRPTRDPVTAASFNVSRPTLRNAADLAAQFGNINYDMNNIKGIFDNATNANYDALGKAYDTTQNQYYNRLYDNQSLAMDTQRKMNASAVTSGASKGMQAATQLSGILGLQQTSAADSTALAQGRNALNDQRLAAMEKNTALAMTQAELAKMDLLKNSQNLYAADTQFSVADLSARAQADLAAKQLQAAGITAEANMYGADQNMAGQIGYGNAVAQGQIESSRLSAEATRAAAASAAAASGAAAGSSYQAPLPAPTFQKLYSDAIAAGDKASAIGYLMQTNMSYADAEKLVLESMPSRTNPTGNPVLPPTLTPNKDYSSKVGYGIIGPNGLPIDP